MNKKILVLLITTILCISAFWGLSVYAAETVNVTTISALQSEHPYTSNMDKTWVYTHSTSADKLEITFSNDTETENNYDYVYILDGSGTQIGKYCGTALSGKTISVSGNVVKIRLTSDGSVTKNGFTVTNIEAINDNVHNVTTVSELQSAHPYANNMDEMWIYTHSKSVDSLKVTFSSSTEVESTYDYIYILDGSDNQIGKYTGTSLTSKTITVPGNVIKIRLTSDSSNTKNGFTVTSISEVVVSGGSSGSSTTPTLTGFASGNGTSSSPYIISTPAHLLYFAQQLTAGYAFAGEYIKLNANLDMTSYTWSIPESTSFDGTFDGNNKTITTNARFLAKIGKTGVVNWLNLRATQTLNSTLMCKHNYGTIQNCSTVGNVVNNPGHAGLLCEYNYGNVYNSCGFGSLTGHGDESSCYVGWVLFNRGTIKNCYTVLVLSGSAPGRYYTFYSDGISAEKNGGGTTDNCFTGDNVIANSQEFVDKLNQLDTVSGYTWAVDTSNVNNGYPVITKCLDARTVLSYSSDSMFAFHSSSITTSITSNVSGCTIYYTLDGTNPTTSSTRKTYSSSLTFSDDFEIRTTAYKNGAYSVPTVQYGIKLYGSGTTSSPYQIKSNLGLYAVRFATDKAYSLETDLDFTNDEYITNGAPADGWTSIPTFSGTFDGKSHSITCIEGNNGGLFGNNTGTIKNLRLLDARLCDKTGGSYFGIITDGNDGAITHCYVDAYSVSRFEYGFIGGIVGNNSGTVSYCRTSGYISTTSPINYSWMRIGGIAGSSASDTINNCYSDMEITTCYSNHDMGCSLGGITASGWVSNCRFDGIIHADVFAAKYSIASAGGSNYGTYCYDGDANIIKPNYTTYTYTPSYSYKKTGSYSDYLESSFNDFDFETSWMITSDGPMPQGVMNADGNYYTKKSYTAPTCTTDGSTVCLNQNNQTVTFKLNAYGHELSEGCCTRCSYKEIYNIEIKNTTTNNFDEIYKDCSYQLDAVLTPVDAIDQGITWASSDTAIATISQNGLLSCLNCGTVKITATANNGVKAELELTIIETPYLNDIAVSGTRSAVVGDSSINHQVILSTDKDVNALYCFIKYPNTLSLKSITAKDFAYAGIEDEYTEDGFTTAVILAQYSDVDFVPKYEILTPFELTFDVSKSATPGTIQIEATEESCLIGNETYFFEEIIACSLEILSKLAEGIEISGADIISSATTYTAIVTPDYTTDKSVEWSVDVETIATVDENGMVTPVTSGTITLTATAKDGSGVSATKQITITRGITNIEIAGADSITEATTYTAIITPDYATNKEVEWSINNTEIATIDQNALVTPVTSGLITITATAKDGSGISVSKDINIIKLAETIEITGEDSISSPAQYTAIVSPDYTSDKEVSWSVDNEAIATVDELGIVTPVTSGTITLTATAKDGSGVIAIKAIEIVKYAESIEIVGDEEITEPTQYNVVILPEYTTNKNAEWSVSDEEIAIVDENGLVTPLKNGKIVLTAKAEDASGIETTKSIVITVSVRANSITSDVGVWDKDFDSDITEYTITVSSETSAIYLTSSFTNATAKVNGSPALNGVRKKVNLTGSETNIEILLTPTTGNTLKANTYKITVVRGSFTKTTVSENGKSFIVTPINIENGKTVILALYDGEKFVEMQSEVYEGIAIPFATAKAYTNAKVMVWDNLTNLKPVCNVEIVK